MLAVVVATSACGGERPLNSEGERKKGAFPLVHADTILAWTSSTQFVAGTVGHTDLELFELDSQLRVTNGGPIAQPNAACVSPFPIAALSTDIDSDGDADVLVMDASCGNWVALQRSGRAFDSVPWTNFFPETLALPYLELLSDNERPVLSIMTFDFGQVLTDLDQGPGATVTDLRIARPRRWNNITRLAFTVHSESGQHAILQGGEGSLFRVRQDGPAVTLEPLDTLDLGGAYLTNFDGLDHVVTSTRCGVALGIGVFGSDAGPIPGRLSYIQMADDLVAIRPFEPSHELDSVAVLDSGTETWIAMLDSVGEQNRLRTARMTTDCTDIVGDSLASQDFLVRRPKELWLPEVAGAPNRFSGTVISGTWIAGDAVFVTYDGFSLHVFARDADSASMRYNSYEIHDAATYEQVVQ